MKISITIPDESDRSKEKENEILLQVFHDTYKLITLITAEDPFGVGKACGEEKKVVKE